VHSGEYLLWKFLLFENYGQEVGGTNTLLVPNLKVGGPVSPVPTIVAPMEEAYPFPMPYPFQHPIPANEIALITSAPPPRKFWLRLQTGFLLRDTIQYAKW